MPAWARARDLEGRGVCGPRRVHLTAVELGWHDAKTMYPGSICRSHVKFRSMVRKCFSQGDYSWPLGRRPESSLSVFLMLLQFHRRNDDVSVDSQLAVLSQLPGAAAGNLAAAAVARCSTSSGFAARNVAMLPPCSYVACQFRHARIIGAEADMHQLIESIGLRFAAGFRVIPQITQQRPQSLQLLCQITINEEAFLPSCGSCPYTRTLVSSGAAPGRAGPV